MKHEILDDNVQTSDDTIRRVLKLARLDGSQREESIEHEIGADELCSHFWPLNGRKVTLRNNRIEGSNPS